jgi:hypothetical protein
VGVRRGTGNLLKQLLAVGALALLLVACASPTDKSRSVGGQGATTTVRTFAAYDAKGNLTVNVADVSAGKCWTSSIADPRADAYRCWSGNKILDPCFAPSGKAAPNSVACLADPWSDALVLNLTEPLPHVTPVAAGIRPWALQLDNGVRCVASTGMVPSVKGVNLAFRCTNGAAADVVDARATAVTANYGWPKGKTLLQRSVTTMWRG